MIQSTRRTVAMAIFVITCALPGESSFASDFPVGPVTPAFPSAERRSGFTAVSMDVS